ncbi:hypothetical protein ACMFMG_003272 [Clarireedia jacksonii]
MLAVSDGVAAASSQPDSLKPDCSNQLIHAPSTDIASSVTFSPVPPELILGSSPIEAHFPTDINHPNPEIQITPPPSIRETSPPSASSGSGSWMAFTHPPPAVEEVRAALVESTRHAHKTNKHTANIKMIRKMVIKKLELPEDYFNDLEWKHRSTVIIENAFKQAWLIVKLAYRNTHSNTVQNILAGKCVFFLRSKRSTAQKLLSFDKETQSEDSTVERTPGSQSQASAEAGTAEVGIEPHANNIPGIFHQSHEELPNMEEAQKSMRCLVEQNNLANQRILDLLARVADQNSEIKNLRTDLLSLKLRNRASARREKQTEDENTLLKSQAAWNIQESSHMKQAIKVLEDKRMAVVTELESLKKDHTSFAEIRGVLEGRNSELEAKYKELLDDNAIFKRRLGEIGALAISNDEGKDKGDEKSKAGVEMGLEDRLFTPRKRRRLYQRSFRSVEKD